MVVTATVFPKSDTGSVWWRKDADKGCYFVFDNFEQEVITASSTLSTATYSAERDHHVIRNIGTASCYVNFDAVATTASYRIMAGDYFIVDTNATEISSLCETNNFTLIRIIGQS